jgi:hypothetical protein
MKSVLKFFGNIILFLAAPFIALAYIVALPIVGMYQFTKLTVEKFYETKRSRNTG